MVTGTLQVSAIAALGKRRTQIAACVLLLCAGINAWIYWPGFSPKATILRAGGTVQLLTNPEHRGEVAITLPDTISDRDLAQMAALDKLKPVWLQLRGRQITGEGLKSLTRLPGLYGLTLHSTMVGDGDLIHLQAFPKLETLMLDGSLITDGGLPHLKDLSSLKCVSLLGTIVSAKAIQKLQSARPDLSVLSHYNTSDDD